DRARVSAVAERQPIVALDHERAREPALTERVGDRAEALADADDRAPAQPGGAADLEHALADHRAGDPGRGRSRVQIEEARRAVDATRQPGEGRVDPVPDHGAALRTSAERARVERHEALEPGDDLGLDDPGPA